MEGERRTEREREKERERGRGVDERTEQIWLLYPAVKRGQKTSKNHVAIATV